MCRYFAYVQVAEEEQNLWEEYARLQETAAALRDAQGDAGVADLSGIPRSLQDRRSRGMSIVEGMAAAAALTAEQPIVDTPASRRRAAGCVRSGLCRRRRCRPGRARRSSRCPIRATGPSS